jgi:hypothetical protein
MPEDLVFSSDDLGVTEHFLSEAYARMRLSTGDNDRTRSRVMRRWLGKVSVDQLDFGFTLSYKVRSLNRICVCRMHSGTIEENFIGEPSDVFAPGDVTILTPPDLPYSGRLSQASYDLTMFDPGLLDRVAAAAPNRRPEAVRLLGHRPVSAAAGQHLSNVIDLPERPCPGCTGRARFTADRGHRHPTPGGERTARLSQQRVARADFHRPARLQPGAAAPCDRLHRG